MHDNAAYMKLRNTKLRQPEYGKHRRTLSQLKVALSKLMFTKETITCMITLSQNKKDNVGKLILNKNLNQVYVRSLHAHLEFSINSATFLLFHDNSLELNEDSFSLGSLLCCSSGSTLPTHSSIHLDACGRHQSLHQTG